MPRRLVCARCAQIKQACSGSNPCKRCERLGASCDYGQGNATHTSTGSTSAAKSIRIRRSHSGCATCKKRKRKCDEVRPKCSDCRRLCLECHYVDSASENGMNIVSPYDLGQVQLDFDSTATYLEPASTLPISYAFSDALSCSAETYSAFDIDDDAHTTASSSQRDSVEGGSSALLAAAFPSTPSSSPSIALSSVPMILNDKDKSLFNHYVKVVGVVLSRCDNRHANPFLTNIVPIAMSDPLVMGAVLALSASHWKRLQPDMWKRALKSLAKLLPLIQNDSADVALIATLLLAMVDLFDGTSSHWKFHLDGVRQLLSAFKQHASLSGSSGHRIFYSQLYHYLDSATTISTCHPPLLEAPDGSHSHDAGHSTEDETALYGIPKSLFHFVDKINGLAYQRKFRDDPVFESMFLASASRLQQDIEKWSIEHKTNHEATQITSTQDTAVYYATIAFEQALQLRLHQVVRGYSVTDEEVRNRVDQILDAVQEIHYGNPIESSLVFPLVMAGSSCCDSQQQLIINDRFLIMERTSGFQYVYVAHELVQRVWNERDQQRESGQEINWAAIRYYDIPGLAFV